MKVFTSIAFASAALSFSLSAVAEPFALTNENAVLSVDARGWFVGLSERATGRVLADGEEPFVSGTSLLFIPCVLWIINYPHGEQSVS